jgi:hypothetical protein
MARISEEMLLLQFPKSYIPHDCFVMMFAGLSIENNQ